MGPRYTTAQLAPVRLVTSRPMILWSHPHARFRNHRRAPCHRAPVLAAAGRVLQRAGYTAARRHGREGHFTSERSRLKTATIKGSTSQTRVVAARWAQPLPERAPCRRLS
jgi:hypothetical protein